ncbi:hypothetical protein GGQ88_001966 [Novosphingobium hassiacum]|uniref:Uncharacterized protein n=1 Tax=Novosphingobium hassiacum TaxID=173676 RepID=A0A7W5ZWK6_9SPHN|nr:hypothetical protein [Novosphingobium hassiacum]
MSPRAQAHHTGPTGVYAWSKYATGILIRYGSGGLFP